MTAWAIVGLLTLGAFVEIVREVLTRSGLTAEDTSVATFIADHRVAGLAALLSLVTWAGSSFFLIPLTIAIGIFCWARWRTIRPLLLIGATYGGAGLSYAVLKPVVGRMRPSAALQYGPPDEGWAFPSGHTTQSAAYYGTLAVLVFASRSPHRRLVAVGAGAMVVLMGFCRLYIGVHWLTDVLGGLLLGLTWVAIVQLATAAIDHRRNR